MPPTTTVPSLAAALVFGRRMCLDADPNLPAFTDEEMVGTANALLVLLADELGERLTAYFGKSTGGTGWSVTNGQSQCVSVTDFPIHDLRFLFRETADTATYGALMKRQTLAEILKKQDTQTDSGPPTEYALVMQADTALAGQRKGRLLLWPKADNNTYYFSAVIRDEPYLYANSSPETEFADLTALETYRLWTAVAVIHADLMGRYELSDRIARWLPEQFQAAASIVARQAREKGETGRRG